MNMVAPIQFTIEIYSAKYQITNGVAPEELLRANLFDLFHRMG